MVIIICLDLSFFVGFGICFLGACFVFQEPACLITQLKK